SELPPPERAKKAVSPANPTRMGRKRARACRKGRLSREKRSLASRASEKGRLTGQSGENGPKAGLSLPKRPSQQRKASSRLPSERKRPSHRPVALAPQVIVVLNVFSRLYNLTIAHIYQLSVASATNSTYDNLVASATIRKLDVIQKTGGR
ncbi:hypothetical protein, partial [Paenibacillus alba]